MTVSPDKVGQENNFELENVVRRAAAKHHE